MTIKADLLTPVKAENIRTLVEIRQKKRNEARTIREDFKRKGDQAAALPQAEADQADAMIKSIEAVAQRRAATENLMKARQEVGHA